MKDIVIGLLICSLLGMILKYRIDIDSKLDKVFESGYNSGYHDAKLTYECNHDRAECEILNEEIWQNQE